MYIHIEEVEEFLHKNKTTNDEKKHNKGKK